MPYRHSDVFDLSQLTREEGLAFAALLLAVLRADGQVDDGEREQLARISEELGGERLSGLLQEASRQRGSDRELRRLAMFVDRQPAREVIFGALFDLAAAESLVAPEEALLDWLADAWVLHLSEPGEG